MTKSILLALCCLYSTMHYAMEQEQKWYTHQEKWEKNSEAICTPIVTQKPIICSTMLGTKAPEIYKFRIRFDNNGSPYTLSLLLDKTDEYPINPSRECTVDEKNAQAWSLGVFKDNKLIKTKGLNDFLPGKNKHYYADIPFENSMPRESKIQYRNLSSEQEHMATLYRRLQTHKNVIDMSTCIIEEFSYGDKMFFKLKIEYFDPLAQYVNIERRSKTFTEHNITKRTLDRNKAFKTGMQFPLLVGNYCTLPEWVKTKIHHYNPHLYADLAFHWNDFFGSKTLDFLRTFRSSTYKSQSIEHGYLEGIALSTTALAGLYGLYVTYIVAGDEQ